MLCVRILKVGFAFHGFAFALHELVGEVVKHIAVHIGLMTVDCREAHLEMIHRRTGVYVIVAREFEVVEEVVMTLCVICWCWQARCPADERADGAATLVNLVTGAASDSFPALLRSMGLRFRPPLHRRRISRSRHILRGHPGRRRDRNGFLEERVESACELMFAHELV